MHKRLCYNKKRANPSAKLILLRVTGGWHLSQHALGMRRGTLSQAANLSQGSTHIDTFTPTVLIYYVQFISEAAFSTNVLPLMVHVVFFGHVFANII